MAIYNYALAALVLSNLSTSAMSSMTFTAMTKENLIDKFISADGDVEFSNIRASPHYSQCTRYYTGGHSMGYAWLNDDNATLTDTYLLPDEGIMLSSGDPLDFESNDSDQETTRWYNSNTYYYDSDLAATINNQAIFDACFIEFDFKCSGEGYVPQVSFKYLFGSEEYYEYVDSPYNDAFALILNGVNIAKLPSSESDEDVVSINNVNYHLNRQYFHGNDPGTGDLADPMHDDLGMIYPQIEPDGFTLIMTAHGIPHQNPQQTNTIKIVVGDVGDGILDSWVLLQSGTFSCVDITEAPSVSLQPSNAPTLKPSVSKAPTLAPSASPTLSTAPTAAPSVAPTISVAPTGQPSASPSVSTQPSAEPTANPSLSKSPSANPTSAPSVSSAPTDKPSASPSTSTKPSSVPSSNPTLSSSPSANPTTSPSISVAPTGQPSASPSVSTQPSAKPTANPSLSKSPSANPTDSPSISSAPTDEPSASPSISTKPSGQPTSSPSLSSSPSANPTDSPSVSTAPTDQPSASPSTSTQPSGNPTASPSLSSSPSANPTDSPSISSAPSANPTSAPSSSSAPTDQPSASPSISTKPTSEPSLNPSLSSEPTSEPSLSPSVSTKPTSEPSASPSTSTSPTASPSSVPTAAPSSIPTVTHSTVPSLDPTVSSSPSVLPSSVPSVSTAPQGSPSANPTVSLSPTTLPSLIPTISSAPSSMPSLYPTISAMPTSVPSLAPSSSPTQKPSASPSVTASEKPSVSKQPSHEPSSAPSLSSNPSSSPSAEPSVSKEPTGSPSSSPSVSSSPSSQPTEEPSISKQPSHEPSSAPSLSTRPTSSPSAEPSVSPTQEPSASPSLTASDKPSVSSSPSSEPTEKPSISQEPTSAPSLSPTVSSKPSNSPSAEPSISKEPTGSPSSSPSVSSSPSSEPTAEPSVSKQPSHEPSAAPSLSSSPSSSPSAEPSVSPSSEPSANPSLTASGKPSVSSSPSLMASEKPSISKQPSREPTSEPSLSTSPTSSPSATPSVSKEPTGGPTLSPTVSNSPSNEPTANPSLSTEPSTSPSSSPSKSSEPSSHPTSSPSTSSKPSDEPSLAPSKSSEPSASPTDDTYMPSVSLKPSSSPTDQPSISSAPSSAPSKMASVGPNTVFNDLNADGFQDENEEGLANITVVLYNATDDSPVATTETDENGVYEFNELTAGSYYATVLNVTYYFSPVQEGGNQATANVDGPNGNTPTVELNAGGVIDDWNVGLYEPVTVGNRVWLDYNADGVHDEDEPGLGNITVVLVDQSGNPIEGQVQMSDPEGYYLFTGLPPGVYGVEFIVPDDYNFSPQNPLSDSIDRSNPNAGDYAADIDSSGMAAPAELESGTADLSFDAGIYAPITIGGTIFLDLSADGIRDAEEVDGVEGVTLILYDSVNNVTLEEAVTSADGSYAFPPMPPGLYHVELLVPSEEYLVSPLAEGGNTFDTSYDPAKTSAVRVISGFDAENLFDGALYEKATTSLYVWFDSNGNGLQDEGESPYSNATVNIYESNSTTPVATVAVAPDGTFTYDIAPGSYTVEVVVSDADAVFSPQDQGSDDTIDSDVDADGRISITVVSGEEINMSAGVTAMPEVASCVFLDSNGNGLQDEGEPPLPYVEVQLYHANGTLADVTTSDETCLYEFTAPHVGDYFVTVVLPPEHELSPVVDGGNQISSNEDGTNSSPVVTLTLGYVEDSWDVGMYVPVSIGNRVWNDLNGDGIQGGDEPGIENIMVSLNNQDGSEIATTATDSTGHYLFEGLSPGNYSVKFQLPDEFLFTIPAKTTADIVDPADGSYAYDDVTSDADRDTGSTPVTMVLSGTSNLSLDAGMFIPVSINGTTWQDTNADGFLDEGEPVLEGATIILYDVDGDIAAGTSAVVVDGSGVWNVDGLPPGTYSALIQPPSGEWSLSPIPETEGNVTSTNFDPADSKTTPVYLQSGDSGWGHFDAGFYLPASVGDRVWFDEEPNGIQDFGEPPMDGPISVKLYDSLGYLQGETETSAGGFYQFTNLRPGTYVVEFILPSEDFNFAILNAGDDDSLDSDADPKTGRAQVTLVSGEINDNIDAGIMDSAPYYPDWTNDVQVCTNDGFDPAWLEIQEVNYLYSSKEACCKQHFWWRMTQCMANEEFKFYQKEDKCDTKVVFEDWESNTPDLFHGGETTLFDTLEECCAHKFWFDYDGCLGRSPLIYKFEFCVDIQDLAVPLDCQSADIYGQVLEHAFNVNADIGLGEVDAAITKIGDASLEKVAGNTVCGGSLEGTFTNDLTGSNPDIDGAAGTTTEVCGTMTVEAGNDCADETCLMAQYQQISQALTEASTTGGLTDSIRDKAITRLPPVPELQSVDADNVSIYDVLMPATITGDLETKFFFGTDLSTCSEKPTITFAPGDANYDTLHACCTQHFGWDIAGCCTNGGGCPELPPADDPADDVVDGYYPTWDNTALCRYKSGFESWEERFDTLEACCTAKFNYDTAYDNCMNPTNP